MGDRRLAADPDLVNRLDGATEEKDPDLFAFVRSPAHAIVTGPLDGKFANVRLDAPRIVALSRLTPR